MNINYILWPPATRLPNCNSICVCLLRLGEQKHYKKTYEYGYVLPEPRKDTPEILSI
jgi:hypothetical protein